MKELMALLIALGPVLWVALAIWFLVRQATRPKLSASFFAVALVCQMIIIALPFQIHTWSVDAAGLSDFTVCPNGQEYCDDFYQMERLVGRTLFHFAVAIWVGVLVWLLCLSGKADSSAKRRV